MNAGASLGLAWLSHETGRDLQRGVRAAGGASALWEGSPAVLRRALRVDEAEAGQLHRMIRETRLDDLRGMVTALGQRFVSSEDGGFPGGLRDLFDPPFGLFLVGGTPDLSELLANGPVIGIVGARRASADGMSFAEGLARALVARGATVVSGMARGIDTAAHRGAIEGGGRTIAVLGCGADVSYPAANRALHSAISEGGVVASEYWPGTRPAPWRFPARNRIVAGLCDGVIVVEAGSRSGALITADFALELGRPVLAVPGRPGSEVVAGCHGLIRSGAALCEAVEDVVSEVPHPGWLDSVSDVETATAGLGGEIVAVLREGPRSFDELTDLTSADPGEISAAVAELEIRFRLGDVAQQDN